MGDAKSAIARPEEGGPFSFEGMCDALKIDPRRVRNRLLCWREERLAGERPPMMRIPRSARMAGRASLSTSGTSHNLSTGDA
jgi:hypothetical protein